MSFVETYMRDHYPVWQASIEKAAPDNRVQLCLVAKFGDQRVVLMIREELLRFRNGQVADRIKEKIPS